MHDKNMIELLRMIADGDFHTPVPRCGALLRELIVRGWAKPGDQRKADQCVLVTTAGQEALRCRT